jgi:hypothetical protein
MVVVAVVCGLILLVLPGIYIACRTILVPYLVMDKGLAPMPAFKASWALMPDYWFHVVFLGLIAACMCVGGLLLFVIGIFPAIAWVSGMFASFYQQVIDAHDEEFLLSLDIAP